MFIISVLASDNLHPHPNNHHHPYYLVVFIQESSHAAVNHILMGMVPIRNQHLHQRIECPLDPRKYVSARSHVHALELDNLVLGALGPGRVLEDALCYLLVLSDALDVCQDLLFAAI